MEHPPYSPDLALNKSKLFPKIKSALKERRFQDTENIKKAMTTLKDIPKQNFEKRFHPWQAASLG
jgi:hypothetical protein